MQPSDLARLYDEHAQALFGFLISFTRNEADTHDLLQQVFVKLAEEPTLWRTSAKNVPFCFAWPTISRSTCFDAEARARGTTNASPRKSSSSLQRLPTWTGPPSRNVLPRPSANCPPNSVRSSISSCGRAS